MIAREFIQDADLYTISDKSTVADAIQLMESLHARQLIVMADGTLKGIVSEQTIYDSYDDTPLRDVEPSGILRGVFIKANDHIYHVLDAMQKYNCSVLPVLDQDLLIGVITQDQLLIAINKLMNIAEHGTILLIESIDAQGSLSEVLRIIEQERVKVYTSVISYIPDSAKEYYTIKTAALETQPLILALERYGYSVYAANEEGEVNGLWMDRFESLMHYLNV